MQTVKTIFKIIMLIALLVVLFWVFRAIGLTTLNSFNIQVEEIIVEFFSFILALYLSIKSFYNNSPLKVTLIVLASFFMLLIASIIITKIILNSGLEEKPQQIEVKYIIENQR